MTVVSVAGDPEKLSDLLNTIISGGNEILNLHILASHSYYIVAYQSSGPVTDFYLLLENGDKILLESGDKIILQ